MAADVLHSIEDVDAPALSVPTRDISFPERALTAGSLIDSARLPLASWDHEVLRKLAGVDRVGEITLRRTEIFDNVDEFLRIPVDGVLALNSWGVALGNRIRDAIERRCCLWLATVHPDTIPHLEKLFGAGLVKIAGTPGVDGRLPVALNPCDLVRAWATDSSRRGFLRKTLSGADTLRTPRKTVATLRSAKVFIRERSLFARLWTNPKAIAYFIVFVYSTLRALPVAFVPGFTGKVWVLWSIDVITAIPYTWGVLTAVAGRNRLMRLLGLIVTIVTFVAPYVYFWAHGKNAPPGVLLFVAAMIVGAVALEFGRWLRDKVVAQHLTHPQYT